MGRTEAVTLVNLCMICDGHGSVLVQEKEHPVWGGITFPGGHVEPGESLVGAVIREVREETGLEIDSPRLCGTVCWAPVGETRKLLFLYRAERFSGRLLERTAEGRMFWTPADALDTLPLAKNMDAFLRLYREENLSEAFTGQPNDGNEHFIFR